MKLIFSMIILHIVGICTVFSTVIPQVFSLSNEITYVGCYDVTLATTVSYNTVVKPVLSWEICATLCTNRLTVFAGINANNFTCFCGNEIAELLTVTVDSKCVSCLEDPTKYCGGPGAVSVYRVRARFQIPTLLLATNQGIVINEELSPGNYHTEILLSISSGATAVAYHFRNQEIYYVSSNKIFKVAYVSILMKYYHPMFLVETNCSQVADIAIDWVHEKIYWACYSTRKVHSANIDGSNIQRPIGEVYDLQHISVEPFINNIFYAAQKKLKCYNFTLYTNDVLYNYGFRETLQIAIDVQQETVYAIGSYAVGGSKKYLVSTNYDWTVFKVVYSGPELLNSFALDVFNGTIIWGSKNSTDDTLYSGTVSSKCELENVKIVYSGNNFIKDLKIFGPEVQTPSRKYLCKERNCSHTCSLISPTFVRCSCPESMLLSRDGRTCVVSSNPSVPLNTSTNLAEYTDAKVASISQTSESNEISSAVPTKASLESRLQVHNSHLQLICVTVVVCVTILFVLAIFQVYVYMMMKRSNGDFVFRYHKRSDLDEPTYSEPNRNICNVYSCTHKSSFLNTQ